MKELKEKIKNVFSSVKVKLFVTLSLTILLVIVFLIIVNNFALENFYLYKKEKTLKAVYETINNYYQNANYDNDIATELEKIAIRNNFDILIKDNNGINVYTTNKNFSSVIGTINDIIDKFNNNYKDNTDNYTGFLNINTIYKVKNNE